MLHVVRMIQVSRYRWHLFSPKGHVLCDDLLIESSYKAEEWIKSYISSYQGWSYVILPLLGGKYNGK